MVKCKDGPYVCHEQHTEIVAALAADKQAADRATFDAIRAFTVLKDEVAALQAENERLRKAGDEMENRLYEISGDFDLEPFDECGKWNKAKAKGVQP